jgi:hypothetical protein
MASPPSEQDAELNQSPQSPPKPQVKIRKVPAEVQKRPQSFLSDILGGIKASATMPATKPSKTVADCSLQPMSYCPSAGGPPTAIASVNATAYTPIPRPASTLSGRRHINALHEDFRRLDYSVSLKVSLDTGLPCDSAIGQRHTSTLAREATRCTRIPRPAGDSCYGRQQTPSLHNIRHHRDAASSHGGDSYRLGLNKQQGPRRLQNRHEYANCGAQQLLREAKIRHLKSEYEDVAHLSQILMVNDKNFFKYREELRHSTISQLLEDAGSQNLPIDRNRRWERHSLLIEVAEMMARKAVSNQNGLVRADKVNKQVATRGAAAIQDHTSRIKYSSKGHIISQKIKIAEVMADAEKKLKSEHAKKDKEIHGSGHGQITLLKKIGGCGKKIFPLKTKKDKNTARISHQSSDVESSTGKLKTKESPIVSHSEEESDGPVYRTTKCVSRRGGRQALLSKRHVSSKKVKESETNQNKQSRAAKDGDEIEEKPCKKRKSAYDNEIASDGDAVGADNHFNASSALNDEIDTKVDSGSSLSKTSLDKVDEIEVLVVQQGKESAIQETDGPVIEADDESSLSKDDPHDTLTDAKTSNSKTVNIPSFYKDAPAPDREISDNSKAQSSSTPDTSPDAQPIPSPVPKMSNKRKSRSSEEDEYMYEVPSKKIKTKTKRKPIGFTTEERIAGLTYTKNSDGTWNLKERIKKVGSTAKPKSKPAYNFVKS